ncbi:hypothetical protein [Nocardia sp. NPDC057227]|uniref:hypothetical protein n=1 Tax=Nocardia sp. NPDC057227 TaxID=3346056 RepID=UPI0036363934
MHIDDLPIHPTTGLRALGIGRRGPIWPIIGASEDHDPDEPAGDDPVAPPQDDPPADPAPAFQPITSQADLDRIIGRRVGQERAKYADYDDKSAKAAEYEKLEDAKKSTEQRLNDQLNAANSKLAALELNQLRREIADAKGLPAKFAKRLTGTTREELEADADDLLDTIPTPDPPVVLSQKPRENLRGGGRPDEEPEETDPYKLAAKIPR